jgi:hypothetical protein
VSAYWKLSRVAILTWAAGRRSLVYGTPPILPLDPLTANISNPAMGQLPLADALAGPDTSLSKYANAIRRGRGWEQARACA